MSFSILFWDEIRGFIKSKIMIALWVGMPVLSIILHFIQPEAEGMSVTILTSLLLASIGGLLAAVMLSTSIVNERTTKVYDLFLIRPVKRWHLLVTKYLAVFLCLSIASILSIALGIIIDYATIGLPATAIVLEALNSLAVALAAMSISCVIGILIGILVNSVALAAILSIYLGEQLSVIAVLPSILLPNINPALFSIGIGLGITIAIMIIEIVIFNKKQF
ncbi:MAG: hypothetical protein JXA54_11860 [Candidatus Heimdallarchaeota archaeon]|nr:hypothetical protein [Candidatus Heimdallarchaeota archaeon]